jgi:hypothetical protein
MNYSQFSIVPCLEKPNCCARTQILKIPMYFCPGANSLIGLSRYLDASHTESAIPMAGAQSGALAFFKVAEPLPCMRKFPCRISLFGEPIVCSHAMKSQQPRSLTTLVLVCIVQREDI